MLVKPSAHEQLLAEDTGTFGKVLPVLPRTAQEAMQQLPVSVGVQHASVGLCAACGVQHVSARSAAQNNPRKLAGKAFPCLRAGKE